MSKNNSLSDEWKDTVYNIGGALYGLGKIVCKSVKYGVDTVYEKINEEEKTGKKPTSEASKKSEEE